MPQPFLCSLGAEIRLGSWVELLAFTVWPCIASFPVNDPRWTDDSGRLTADYVPQWGLQTDQHQLLKTELLALFTLFFAGALIAATIDIACDGFCVDQLSVRGYGWGNVAQVGGQLYCA
ncbi:hypothetical protein P4S72_18755 [Vibrio sp. PP-XX7]